MKINLLDKVKNLPQSPGVYLMKDSGGQILYVGKAKSLKKRVQTYFQSARNHSPKIKKLVSHLKDFDTIQTDTEFDAFMLECQLIKEIKPHYNRMMKSPQSFVYLVIDLSKKVRTFEISYDPTESEHSIVFGPFTSRGIVERAIQAIKDCYKMNCGHATIKHSACLNYSLGLCNGVCLGGLAVESYNANIDKVIGFLNRTDMRLLEEMQHMMEAASSEFNFEEAAKYRDWLQTVTALLKKEKVIEFTEENNQLIMVEQLDEDSIKVFFIQRTNVLFTEIIHLQEGAMEEVVENLKENAVQYFKTPIDELNVSREEIDVAQIIFSYLNNNDCRYIIVDPKWIQSTKSSRLEKELLKLFKF